MRKMLFTYALAMLLLPAIVHAIDVPKLQGRVNDYAEMIAPQVRAELEKELGAFEQTDSTQIVILTVPSLEGEPIDDFGIKVAESWKIGQAGKANGIIFIVSRQDRKMRIEVGRGLEGNLTDLMAGRIIDLVVTPRFKRGDFDGGFIAGVAALIDATRGEFKADGNQHVRRHDNSSRFVTFLIFAGVAMLVLGSISRVLGGLAGALGLPAIVYLTLAPSGFIWLAILAVVGFLFGLLLPALFSAGGGGFGPGGGFFGTGGGFGGFGGGDSGCGFSGGGGDFGGGGASGDW